MPAANLYPAGARYNWFVTTGSITNSISPSALYPGSGFIYAGSTTYASGSGGITPVYVGDTAEFTSRGAGSTEWDVTDGLLSQRIQTSQPNNPTLVSKWVLSTNDSIGTAMYVDKIGIKIAQSGVSGQGTYISFSAPFGGTINIVGCIIFQGGLVSSPTVFQNTINYTMNSTWTSYNTLGNTGLTFGYYAGWTNFIWLVDQTNNHAYRIAFVGAQNNSSASGISNGIVTVEKFY